MTSRSYRSDIDGLRAIAILCVVIFHLSPTTLDGGFIGVDVFFVISGYLITHQIRAGVESGTFSFKDFYAKRIRRLYPGLIAVVAVTLVAAYVLLLPTELEKIAKSALSASLYSANIYSYYTVDYFSHDEIRPLLHTWSLSVEEQFYLFFPICLVTLLHRSRKVAGAAIAFLALCSLGYAEYTVERDASLAFYSGLSRFWEFAAGALLTFLGPAKASAPVHAGGALCGLVLIFASAVWMSEASPVPGLIMLAPVLGAVLLLRVGETSNPVSAALSAPPFVYLGKISYALYLVHWPLIVFAKTLYQLSLPRWMEGALLALSILLADLLSRLVERPLRGISVPRRRQWIFATGAGSTVMIALVGVSVLYTDGFASRYPADARRMISYLDYDAKSAFRAGTCLINAEADREDDEFDEASCVNLDDRVPEVLLIGDSYAAQYRDALSRKFPGLEVGQITATGCRPLLDAQGADRCVSLMRRAFADIIPHHRFAAIIVSGRWQSDELPALVSTVRYLMEHSPKVYVFGPMVEYTQPLPRLLALQNLDMIDGDVDRNLLHSSRELERARRLDDHMSRIFASYVPKATYVSVLEQLCTEASCTTVTPKGVPTQFDYGHLTGAGATLVLDRLLAEGQLQMLASVSDQQLLNGRCQGMSAESGEGCKGVPR